MTITYDQMAPLANVADKIPMKKLILISFLTLFSFSTIANGISEDISRKTDPNYLYNRIQQHNARPGSEPIGDKKYRIISKQSGITPAKACMYLEVTCQDKLAKRPDCSLDTGDGIIVCNGKTYKLDSTIDDTHRGIIKKVIDDNGQYSEKDNPGSTTSK